MKSGFIYAIGTAWGEPIKIGVAQDVVRRMGVLQAGNHRTLELFWQSPSCADVYAVEAYLHRHFVSAHIRGEWFNIPNLDAILDAFSDFNGRTSRTKGRQTHASIVCAKAVSVLVDRFALRHRVTVEAAFGLVAEEYGLDRTAIWRLKYKPPVDVWASVYELVAKAVWAECGRDFGTLIFAPNEDELSEAVDILNLRSIYEPAVLASRDFRENTRAYMARADRMFELSKLLQAEIAAADLPNQPDDKSTPRVEK